jgi:hypothetical protein
VLHIFAPTEGRANGICIDGKIGSTMAMLLQCQLLRIALVTSVASRV